MATGPRSTELRAVAVVPVVLYHAHVAGFSGGFVGVDVFFVISGFLITGILAADVAAGRFSILTFYERRVRRRIYPALFVMLAVASVLAFELLLPFELKDFAASLAAASVFRLEPAFHGRDGLLRRRGGEQTAAPHLVAGAVKEPPERTGGVRRAGDHAIKAVGDQPRHRQ